MRAWKNRDKLTTAFLLELPGPHNQWSLAEWGEALCLILSVPPNCSRDPRHLGRPIGNRYVDLWGSDVLCVNVAGGGWTRRHDRVKSCISSLGVYCGVAFVCEPYSLFTSHLPQRPLHRLQAHQVRQAFRPDFLFHLPNTADVKTIYFGNKKLYKPGMQGDTAVKLRAAEVPVEYKRTALQMDQELGFTDGTGPTTRRLQSFPKVLDLCFGAYGEGSEGVKKLLDNFAKLRLRSQWLRKGTPEAEKELGLVTGYLRRRLSTAVVRANVQCLLERMVLVGEGLGQAGKRRQWAQREEERARWDREARWLEKVTGRSLWRGGDFTQ